MRTDPFEVGGWGSRNERDDERNERDLDLRMWGLRAGF